MQQEQFQIGDWLISPQNRTATHPERGEFKLKGKSVQVLVLLAQAKGEVVSKSELLAQVWPDLIVTENSLTQAISELRKMFGDSRNAPKYIQTFPNQGYCLNIPKETSPETETHLWQKPQFIFSLLALFVLLIAVVVWLISKAPARTVISSPDNQYTATIEKRDTGYSLGIFASVDAQSKDLFFRHLSILSPETFAWSADSKYFIAAEPHTNGTYRFIVSPVGNVDKYTIEVTTQLEEHASNIKFSPPTDGSLSFGITRHETVTKYLHVWHLTNGQAIQIQFDQNGPVRIDWH